MLDSSGTSAAPAGVEQTRRRTLGLTWGRRRSPATPRVVVTDEQIIAVVAAADALSRRQRQAHRHDAVASGEVQERLRRLDWAVRAGRVVLAERAAARAQVLAAPPRAPAAERWRVTWW